MKPMQAHLRLLKTLKRRTMNLRRAAFPIWTNTMTHWMTKRATRTMQLAWRYFCRMMAPKSHILVMM